MKNIFDWPVIGDVPGDPELGGWRPLPITYHRNSFVIHVVGLWPALQCLGFELRHHKLTRAMEVIAGKLRQYQ